MRIALIAPPWLPVPPVKYGGTERVLSTLAGALQSRGHEVVLFTVGESTCPVSRMWIYQEGQMEQIGNSSIEQAHITAAYTTLADWDIVHDHSTINNFQLNQQVVPQAIITNHGPFDQVAKDMFRKISAKAPVLAVSHHQASTATGISIAAVIHHGIDLDAVPIGDGKGGFLAHIGRMDPDKGVKEAILVARKVGAPLKIAAKMRSGHERSYFATHVRPLLGGDIEYVGELDESNKWQLLRESTALLNPISWSEPFGLIMAESLAAGTPVLATRRGAAAEIVHDGVTGFLSKSADDLACRVSDLQSISRLACRRSAEARFSATRMAAEHEQFYRAHLADQTDQGASATNHWL